MKKLQEFLSGKKTYIIMAATIGIAIAMLSGYDIPNAVWIIDLALFGGAIKSAIKKTEPPTPPNNATDPLKS